MTSVYARTNPFPGKMVVNRRLNEGNRNKETRHHEISLAGSGLTFEPGDSMAVCASNDPPLVEEIIRALGATGDEIVPAGKNETAPLRQALLRNYSITTPTPKFLKAIVERASAAPLLEELLRPDHKHDLQVYLWGMEAIDFLLQHPSAKFTPEEFVGLLTKLQPRLYSVASCLRVFPESVHFIVDVIRYESHGRLRKGVASTFLARSGARSLCAASDAGEGSRALALARRRGVVLRLRRCVDDGEGRGRGLAYHRAGAERQVTRGSAGLRRANEGGQAV